MEKEKERVDLNVSSVSNYSQHSQLSNSSKAIQPKIDQVLTIKSVINFGSGFLKERLMYFLNKLVVKQVKSFCLLLD